MKKIISLFLILISLSSTFIFAGSKDKDTDPFDTLVDKLLKDFDMSETSIAVKVFAGDISMNERKRISKSVQFALYCLEDIEIASNSIDADYICTGRVEADGPNYIVSVKLVDSYDDTVLAKAKQKVPKNYYATEASTAEVTKVDTVIVEKESDIDADDILGAVIVGSIIGGVFHAVTTPHHHVVPVPAPAPKPRPKPARPRRP